MKLQDGNMRNDKISEHTIKKYMRKSLEQLSCDKVRYEHFIKCGFKDKDYNMLKYTEEAIRRKTNANQTNINN